MNLFSEKLEGRCLLSSYDAGLEPVFDPGVAGELAVKAFGDSVVLSLDADGGDAAYQVREGRRTRRLVNASWVSPPVIQGKPYLLASDRLGEEATLYRVDKNRLRNLGTFAVSEPTLHAIGTAVVIQDADGSFWTSDGTEAGTRFVGQVPTDSTRVEITDARDGRVIVRGDTFLETRLYELNGRVTLLDAAQTGFNQTSVGDGFAVRHGVVTLTQTYGLSPRKIVSVLGTSAGEQALFLNAIGVVNGVAVFTGNFVGGSVYATDGSAAGSGLLSDASFGTDAGTFRVENGRLRFDRAGYTYERTTVDGPNRLVGPVSNVNTLEFGPEETGGAAVEWRYVWTDTHTGVGTDIDGKHRLRFNVANGNAILGRFGDDLWLHDKRADVQRIMRVRDAATPPDLATPGTVRGTVFSDANANGVRDDGDGHLAGFKVFVDLDRNGRHTPDEPMDRVDDRNGLYQFVLPAGTYRLVQTQVEGFEPTTAYLDDVVVEPDAIVTKDFGVAQRFGSIVLESFGNVGTVGTLPQPGVRVWLDLNRDGKRDSDEPTTRTTSTANGTFAEFNGIAPGIYRVGVVDIGGPWKLRGETIRQVTVTGNDVAFSEIIHDATVRDRRASGMVWQGVNGDGLFQPSVGEFALSGRQVFADLNFNARYDADEPFAWTDGSGRFNLLNLPHAHVPIYVSGPDRYFSATGNVLDLARFEERELFLERV